MDARKFFAATFVTLGDLADGPQQKEIDRVEEGKYNKLNLIFTDNCAVSLNATNSRALVKAFGSETDEWPGRSVELAAGELKYDGKLNPAILITALESAPVEKPAAKPKPRGAGRDINDGIPF